MWKWTRPRKRGRLVTQGFKYFKVEARSRSRLVDALAKQGFSANGRLPWPRSFYPNLYLHCNNIQKPPEAAFPHFLQTASALNDTNHSDIKPILAAILSLLLSNRISKEIQIYSFSILILIETKKNLSACCYPTNSTTCPFWGTWFLALLLLK